MKKNQYENETTKCYGKMCSRTTGEVGKMYSSSKVDTRRDRMLSTKGETVEILEFTHFATVFKFKGQSDFGRKKEISHRVNVSVVMELV